MEQISKKIKILIENDPAAKMVTDSLTPFGEVFVVGGAPRDVVLGKKPKDIDLMAKVDPETIKTVLEGIPDSKLVLTGEQFPVYRFSYQGSEVEIALPRIEVKTGEGNKDWEIKSDPSISVEQDLERRDFTANSIAETSFSLNFTPSFFKCSSASENDINFFLFSATTFSIQFLNSWLCALVIFLKIKACNRFPKLGFGISTSHNPNVFAQ